ncbi:MAG: hypothetical protein V7607_2611 [Solirubrobacteraceae bacterium]
MVLTAGRSGRACPRTGAARTKLEVLRWTRRFPNRLVAPAAKPSMGWSAAFHRHHEHGADCWDSAGGWRAPRDSRFAEAIICDQCNAADGLTKRKLGLPAEWSFSPAEIGQFVTATPHNKHQVDLELAKAIDVDAVDS